MGSLRLGITVFTGWHRTSRPGPRGLEIRRGARVGEGPDRRHTVGAGAGDRGRIAGIDTADAKHRQVAAHSPSKSLEALRRSEAPLLRRVEDGAEQGVVGSNLRCVPKFFRAVCGDSQQQTPPANTRAHLPPRCVGRHVNAIGIAGQGDLDVAVHDQDAIESASEGSAEADQIGPLQVLLA